MASCSLPYTMDVVHLPASIPTVHEIESAVEIFSDTTGRKVVGKTMVFLAQTTLIPLPRVYARFQNSARDTTYIVMERIKGSSLDLEWPRMDVATKEAVATQLRNVFREMRKLGFPGGYCSVDHGGLPDGLFWTADPSNPFARPFDSEAKLNEAVIQKYVENGLSKHKASYYTRTFAVVFQNHEPTFSHADFQRNNILMREREAQSDGANPELVLIDWEFAGWYPSYWDYARAIFACGRWEDDWADWVDKVLEPFRNEYAWMGILREMWS
ncbi:kinase-like domain-containing protein [Paraphoma chrysanthemicola]|uniref:Kinase-like domain-containing protein n=1 Tax=Paraphoma chrysanthemicola TaxID=798071 RepID=A0A8K0R4V6_9PLEO|nr:kinase-like domain-containing protein [Paraphoma chrysanthemicola]